MCRHVVYSGPPLALAELALDAPHALIRQCTEAREMSWGCDNLDGWGFAHATSDGELHVHRSSSSLADDVEGQSALRGVTSGRFLLHVRQKTPGSATDANNTAPFTDGRGHLFSHNGYVTGFRDGRREELVGKLSAERGGAITGDTDSEVLFALVLDQLDAGATPLDATRVLVDVADRYGGRYNVVLWHPSGFVATRWDNSLYLSTEEGTLVSSEPIGERAWRPVPERTAVVVDRERWHQEEW
jgi:glutamine amidotransferase